MTLLHPPALYLGLLVGVVLLLALLRTKERRKEVSALFLWEGLREDPRTKASRRRLPIDLLLLLQIAALAGLVLALARPAVRTRSPALSELAIVLDGSASMATAIEDDVTRYNAALVQAEHLVDRYPGARTAIVQHSSRPVVLADRETPRRDAIAALRASVPTANGDGTLDDLLAALERVGEGATFERVVFLSDRRLPNAPVWLETIGVGGGENWSIDAFSARENPIAPGVLVFVRVSNRTDESLQGEIRIDDGLQQVSLSIPLGARAIEPYVIPFPTTHAATFTATLGPADDFASDNVRHFALQRPLDLRIYWIGSENRYLRAALAAAAPVVDVGSPEEADLTVVCDATVPPEATGNVLLVHGEMPGTVTIGNDAPAGEVIALRPDHPLLAGVRAEVLRVGSIPTVESLAAGTVVLAAEETPLLVEFESEERTVTFFASDLVTTNLPITVDFPILVRNVLARLVRIPALLTHETAIVGEPVALGTGRERITSVVAPDGQEIPLGPNRTTFVPSAAGQYRLVSPRGTYPMAANVASSESAAALPAHDLPGGGTPDEDVGTRLIGFWAALAVVAAVLLGAEAVVHSDGALIRRRRW